MRWFWYALVVVTLACSMEGVAWLLHRYVMHGFLWVLHEDHHRPTKTRLQKNDFFAAFFAIPAFSMMVVGSLRGYDLVFFVGLGISLYGWGYILFHDIAFHRRLKGVRWRPDHPYMRRIIRAHRVHHQKSTAHEGVAFGFLYASRSYEQEEQSA
jgi:beta-carotene 3-hydroxylase